MYKNFNITESEKEQILNRLKENGYGQPINEQVQSDVSNGWGELETFNKIFGGGAEVNPKQNGDSNVTTKKEEPKKINPTSNDVAGDLRGQIVNLYFDETEFSSPDMEEISKIIKTNDGCDVYFHDTELSVHFKWKCGSKSLVPYFNKTNQIVKFKPPCYNNNFTNELTKRFCSAVTPNTEVQPEVKIDFPSKRSKQTLNVNPVNEQSTGETPITGTTQTSTENPQKNEPSKENEPSKGSPLRGTDLEGDLKGKVVELCSDKDETKVVGVFTIMSIRKALSDFRIVLKSVKTNKTLMADYSCASTSKMGNWALEVMSVNLDGSGALYYNSDFLEVLKNKFCIKNNYSNDVPNADFVQVKNNTSTTNTLSEGKQILMDVFKKLIK
jgi:hypothetical protein